MFGPKLILLLSVILAFLLRTIFLREIPPGFIHDEIPLALNAQSLVKTGRPLPGTLTGLTGAAVGEFKTNIIAEFSSHLLIPWVAFFGINWPWVKIPFVILNLVLMVIVYLITRELFNAKSALIAAFMFVVNPWSIQMGRSLYEYVAFVFYFLAVYIGLKATGRKIYMSIPFLFAGFFTYYAAKPQLLALGFVLLVGSKIIRKKEIIGPLLLINIFLFIFVLVYFYFLNSHPAGERIRELGTGNFGESAAVKRSLSLNYPGKFIYGNWIIEQTNLFIFNALNGISPKNIFWDGESKAPLTQVLPDQGPMYLIDLVFIVISIIFLVRNKPRIIAFLTLLYLVGIIPGIVSIYGQASVRSGFSFLVLIIVSAGGLYFISQKYPKLKLLYVLCYMFSVYLFLNKYFIYLPLVQSNDWYLQERVLARYLHLTQLNYPRQKITVVTPEQKELMYEYLFFSGNYTKTNEIITANKSLYDLSYEYNNLRFFGNCPDNSAEETILISDSRINCNIENNGSVLASPKDGGAMYIIRNEKLCQVFEKSRFTKLDKIGQLNIESFGKEEFCRLWITNPQFKTEL